MTETTINNDKTSRFLKAFCSIEEVLQKEYNGKSQNTDFNYTCFSKLLENSKNNLVSLNKNKLKVYGKFRNLISHNHHHDIAIPTNKTIEDIEKILSEMTNKKLYNFAIKENQLLYAGLADNAKKIAKKMREENFTYIPIVNDEKKVIGIFSESSLFNYFAEEKEHIIEEDFKISDLEDYIDIDNRKNEKFIFVSREVLFEDVKQQFIDSFKNCRIGAVFITENGKRTEKLLAMATSWDMLNN